VQTANQKRSKRGIKGEFEGIAAHAVFTRASSPVPLTSLRDAEHEKGGISGLTDNQAFQDRRAGSGEGKTLTRFERRKGKCDDGREGCPERAPGRSDSRLEEKQTQG